MFKAYKHLQLIYRCTSRSTSYTVKSVLRGHLWDKEKVAL